MLGWFVVFICGELVWKLFGRWVNYFGRDEEEVWNLWN